MPRYVDGFVIPLPRKNLAAYRRIAKACGRIWLEHGALEYIECVEDDVPRGKLTSFPLSVKRKASEVVVFSWIIYASKRQRDKTNKLVMADPRMKKIAEQGPMPFDGKRLIYGGFKTIVEM